MRKKLTSMVLAAVMVMSMVLPVCAASEIYSDVSEDDWYYDVVLRFYDEGIIEGINEEDGSNSLYPDSAATKEWVTVLLYRLAGMPDVSGGFTTFSDVVADSWYVDAVIWAEMNDIAEGNEDGTFGVGEYITVEEFAVLLYRYSEYFGFDTSDSTDLSDFPDADEVSSSAEKAMEWAVAEKVITGREIDGVVYLAPGSVYSRIGALVILSGYLYGAEDVDEDDMYVDVAEADSESADDSSEESVSSLTYYDFTDLDDSSSWYYEGVNYVIENGIMNGTGGALFSPDGTCTRAMIVTILYRLEGSPEVNGTSRFSDVEEGSWYEDAVIWAEKEGIAQGYDNGEFGVGDNVTREQIATFFYRYAEYTGDGVSASEDLSTFPDVDSVSDWAEKELSWAVAEGLINGVQEGGVTRLAPGDTCTRAMTATILYRMENPYSTIPEYSGDPYVEVNGNIPDFDEDDFTTVSFETYSELDELGRCGVAYACIGTDLMPAEDEERGDISSILPTGWHSVTYDIVDGNYLYNRCHLIGWQLTAENDNERNLITGTRYLNVEGMLPFENMVADYIEETGNHVLYRVTPVFEGDNLVASGVQIEAMSVEDGGEGICFNVYCYNVQPGITIDYATGDSWLSGEDVSDDNSADTDDYDSSDDSDSSNDYTTSYDSDEGSTDSTTTDSDSDEDSVYTYVLNTNSMKFHYSDCSAVSRMSSSNKEYYTGTREEVIAMGYDPCGICNP